MNPPKKSPFAPQPVARKPPPAPPAYRPQPTPKVLQRKVATPARHPATQPARAPQAPPVYRPNTPKVLQPMTARGLAPRATPQAPARPAPFHSRAGVVQRMEEEQPRRSSRTSKPTEFFDTSEVYKQKRGNTTQQQQTAVESFVQKGDIGANYSGGVDYSVKGRAKLYKEGASPLDEIADKTGLSSSSQDTTAVAVSRDQKKIYVANQSGRAAAKALELAGLDVISAAKYEVIPADHHHEGGLHGEMQIIYHCLINNIPLKSIHAMGVAGGKGTCEMCAGVLARLGIGFSFIEKSHFQHLWVNPWKLAGKPCPIPELQ